MCEATDRAALARLLCAYQFTATGGITISELCIPTVERPRGLRKNPWPEARTKHDPSGLSVSSLATTRRGRCLGRRISRGKKAGATFHTRNTPVRQSISMSAKCFKLCFVYLQPGPGPMWPESRADVAESRAVHAPFQASHATRTVHSLPCHRAAPGCPHDVAACCRMLHHAVLML